jgi:hypothetical protein
MICPGDRDVAITANEQGKGKAVYIGCMLTTRVSAR